MSVGSEASVTSEATTVVVSNTGKKCDSDSITSIDSSAAEGCGWPSIFGNSGCVAVNQPKKDRDKKVYTQKSLPSNWTRSSKQDVCISPAQRGNLLPSRSLQSKSPPPTPPGPISPRRSRTRPRNRENVFAIPIKDKSAISRLPVHLNREDDRHDQVENGRHDEWSEKDEYENHRYDREEFDDGYSVDTQSVGADSLDDTTAATDASEFHDKHLFSVASEDTRSLFSEDARDETNTSDGILRGNGSMIQVTLRKPLGIVFEPQSYSFATNSRTVDVSKSFSFSSSFSRDSGYDDDGSIIALGAAIESLVKNSNASRLRRLKEGDELLTINDVMVTTPRRTTFDDIMDMFTMFDDNEDITLLFMRHDAKYEA